MIHPAAPTICLKMGIKLKPETALQANFCKYLRVQYPSIKIHHSPNEGKRTGFQQFLIRLLGVSSGFPDLLLIYKCKAIGIELKAEKRLKTGLIRANSKTSDNQSEWIELLNGASIPAAVCIGLDQAMKFADQYYGPLKKWAKENN